jgi:putative Ca2+/H+ antiporter (TMEM165/GDT1 family)
MICSLDDAHVSLNTQCNAIGDKTFFIAAVMAMRHPRLEVFGSAIAALALMTVLSAAAVCVYICVAHISLSIQQHI